LNKNALEQAFNDLLNAIDHCVATRLRGPALILIYSTIDFAGWLYSDNQSVRTRFTEWVDRYLLPGSALNCNSLDLYGARCGVIHSQSAASDLSKTGKVKKIAYAWAPSHRSDLEKLIGLDVQIAKRLGVEKDPEFVALQVENLTQALCQGVDRFLRELATDTKRAAEISLKAANVLIEISPEAVADMIRKAEMVSRKS